MQVLAEALPSRTTVRQALAFTVIAYSHAAQRSVTLSDLLQTLGVEALGPSIERTIALFFTPTKGYPDALGWVDQVPDPDDRRRKYLTLTPAGIDACSDILNAQHAR